MRQAEFGKLVKLHPPISSCSSVATFRTVPFQSVRSHMLRQTPPSAKVQIGGVSRLQDLNARRFSAYQSLQLGLAGLNVTSRNIPDIRVSRAICLPVNQQNSLAV